MEGLLLQTLTIAYASVSVIFIIGYWPTIRDLYNKKPSASASSYGIWSIAAIITFLYSLFVLPDLLFRIISGLNLGFILIILIMSLNLKKQ